MGKIQAGFGQEFRLGFRKGLGKVQARFKQGFAEEIGLGFRLGFRQGLARVWGKFGEGFGKGSGKSLGNVWSSIQERV